MYDNVDVMLLTAIGLVSALVIGLLLILSFTTVETEQTTMYADNQQDKIISESSDTWTEEVRTINKQDSDQTKEISNPTYITNNYTYNSTGGDFFSDLSINVIAELIAAFILGFLGNKIYSKFKYNKHKG